MKLEIAKILLITVFFLINTVKTDDDDEEDDSDDRPRSCQKYIYDFIKDQLSAVLKCLGGQGSFQIKSIFEYQTRASCLLKCMLQLQGLVSPETGKLDEIAAAFYFEESFDQPVRDIALPEAQACFPLADEFNPKEFWCKSYLPFIECAFRAILKGLIPYGGDCIVNPTIGILFSVLKYLAPDSPGLTEDMEELRRSIANTTQRKCLDKNCTKIYEYKKVNGTQAIVLYNKDMEVISIDTRKTKPKPSSISTISSISNTPKPMSSQYQNGNFYSYKPYNYNSSYKYTYNNNNPYNANLFNKM